MDLKVGLAESFNQIKISGYWMMTTKFDKFPTNGEGGSGEVGMVSHLILVFNYESFPYYKVKH